MAYPFEEAVSQCHVCQWSEWASPHNYDPECYQCCKCDGRFNQFFENKPTDEEIREFCRALYIKGERAKQHAEKRRRALMAETTDDAQFITITIDQAYEQYIKAMYEIIDRIRKSNYKWMGEDAIASFEFYGKEKQRLKPSYSYSFFKNLLQMLEGRQMAR